MDIDKLIQSSADAAQQAGFGSLMDIDKLILLKCGLTATTVLVL